MDSLLWDGIYVTVIHVTDVSYCWLNYRLQKLLSGAFSVSQNWRTGQRRADKDVDPFSSSVILRTRLFHSIEKLDVPIPYKETGNETLVTAWHRTVAYPLLSVQRTLAVS